MTSAVDDTAERVDIIETAFVTHWSHFGGYPGAELHDEDGVLWYESPIPHLPYNAVIRTRMPDGVDVDVAVDRVSRRFAARGVPFMWVVRPTDEPRNLPERLAAAGLDLVEEAIGMDLELGSDVRLAELKPGVEIRRVESDDELRDYEELIRSYWTLPAEVRGMIETLSRHWTGARAPGIRYVAYDAGLPVGKLILNLLDLPVVAVYGVAVKPEARGRGIASALMSQALHDGRARGGTRAVLHSSPMAHSMYLRMGFADRCTLCVYATEPLRGTHHH